MGLPKKSGAPMFAGVQQVFTVQEDKGKIRGGSSPEGLWSEGNVILDAGYQQGIVLRLRVRGGAGGKGETTESMNGRGGMRLGGGANFRGSDVSPVRNWVAAVATARGGDSRAEIRCELRNKRRVGPR